MFCTQCGNQIQSDAAFCTHCGARQPGAPAAAAGNDTPVHPALETEAQTAAPAQAAMPPPQPAPPQPAFDPAPAERRGAGPAALPVGSKRNSSGLVACVSIMGIAAVAGAAYWGWTSFGASDDTAQKTQPVADTNSPGAGQSAAATAPSAPATPMAAAAPAVPATPAAPTLVAPPPAAPAAPAPQPSESNPAERAEVAAAQAALAKQIEIEEKLAKSKVLAK